MERLIQDIRYAFRSLKGSPAFTAIAVCTLALGIGANTAIFSVLNAVLLKPLAYAQPDRLVDVNHFYPSLNNLRANVSVPGFRDYSARKDIFEKAAVQTGAAMNLTGTGDPERVVVERVSGDYFATLGVAPLHGRAIRADEAEDGHNHVVVLTYGFWKEKFGGNPAVVGKSLSLNSESYQIVGIMPATFKDFFGRATQLFTPIVFQPTDFGDNRRTNEFLNFIGRLAPGVSVQQAQQKMHDYAVQLRNGFPNSYSSDWDLQVTSLNEDAVQNLRPALLVLLGAVGFVLLIACANVANLQLARTAARGREIAVRVALGASPTRLVRQLLTESVMLALGGGILGLLLAIWGVPALLSLNAANLPPAGEVGVDGKVLGFALVVSLLTGLLFGMMPAIQVARGDLHESLKEGGRGSSGQRSSLALRRGLVVTTVAMALTLLAGAGLLFRSFSRLTAISPGFQPDHLLTFVVVLPAAKYGNDTVRIAALERLDAAIGAVPGVKSAGGTTNIPFGGNWSSASFSVEGFTPPPKTPGPWGDIRVVTNDFLPTIKAPLIAGRQFTEGDRLGTPLVAIVDDQLAHKYWPSESAVGKRITYGNPTDTAAHWITIVGVVGHTLHEGLDANPRVQVYRPLGQVGMPFLGFTVRTAGEPNAMLNAIRASVHSVDADLPLANVNTMDALIEQSTGPRRFAMLLLGVFAGVALLLASIGLYGVMSYTVTQRARELGVRVALGANTSNVLGLVLGQGARLALLGVVIGLAASFGVTRVMRKMLFNTSTSDPITFAAISLLLIAVAMLASYIPARRATKVDPIVALRAD
ncbi:MAG TPA: ABC transporter permease [Gemmatimonadales bacterium]|jgi:putative ABC transport system permease protein